MVQAALAGLVAGGAYAMIGVVVVGMFRMVRVLNFAQAAIGAFGTFTMSQLYAHGMSYAPATVLGVASAAAVSVVLGAVMSLWFADARIETRSTVAIAMLIGLLMLGFRIFGDQPRNIPQLFGTHGVKIAGVVITAASITVVVVTIVIAVSVGLFLRRTRTGLRLRALSERPQTAELLGVPARWFSIAVWAIGGALAALGIQVVAPTRANDFLSLSLLVIPAFAAASIGLFRSFTAAVVGGIAIGLIEGLSTHYNSIASYQEVVPLIVLALVLLWSQRHEVWDAAR
jgi:branched-chain amino acid transport system permease protein